MRNFIDDVTEQPEVLQRVAAFYASPEGSALLQQVVKMAELNYQSIIFTGMGSSFAASRLAAVYLWSQKVPAVYIEASELLHYGMEALATNALIILISQSGESIEIKQIIKELPAATKFIGITNERASTLAKHATVVLPLLAGEESTTSSKTYTSTIAVTLLICSSLTKQNPADGIAAITAASRKFSAMESYASTIDWSLITEWLKAAKSIYLIGRGPAVSTAIQGALTFKELVKVQAESMEAATFRHGPLETVNEQTLIFVLASVGRTSELANSFTAELVSCGAKVIVIDEGMAYMANESYADAVRERQTSLDEFFTALVDIYPIQIAANRLAQRLNRDGGFKWITKVTQKE